MTNVLTLCPAHRQCNPYRKSTSKHTKWNELCDYMDALATDRSTVYDVLQNTNYSAAELWKEARMDHLVVEVAWCGQTERISVVDWFDNVRKQWTEVQVVCGYSKEPIVVLQANDHTELTIHDICERVEEACEDVWKPTEEQSGKEWAFVLQSSDTQTLLNTTAEMQSKWWSSTRFAHHTHDYSKVACIEVYPCEFGLELKDELGLVGNRCTSVCTSVAVTPPQGQPKTTTNETTANWEALRQEQDSEYYASLQMDKAKQHQLDQAKQHQQSRRTTTNQVTLDQAKQANHEQQSKNTTVNDTESVGEDDTEVVPLTKAQLREARCRFFQSR